MNGFQYPVPIRMTGILLDLLRLNQRQRLAELVERAEAAGQRDERVRILEQQHLCGRRSSGR